MKDFGIIKPQYGRWVWPFSAMEEGDHFLVAREDRETGRVRNLAYTTGQRIGKRFAVVKDQPPGYTMVVCSPVGYDRTWLAPSVDWGVLHSRVEAAYEINIDELGIPLTMFDHVGARFWAPRPAVEKPVREHYVFETPGAETQTLHFHFRTDGVMVTRIEDGTTYQQLKEQLKIED